MKFLKYPIYFLLVLSVAYGLGPRVKYDAPKILDTDINVEISNLEDFIRQNESRVTDLKPDNEARIIWADDSLRHKTDYALVYLHGFSASQEEGDPLHTAFGSRYGMNVYLSRLEDHGRRDTNSFEQLTPENFLQSAEDAIDIGKKLGNKVIVMSCSTGGTLSAILASAGEDIHSMIMYSPNIDIYDPKSDLLLYPWGKKISEWVLGGQHNRIVYDTLAQKYWNSVYHTNSLFALETMITDYMNAETFAKIKAPVFMGYYYKDEDNQDKVVSVSRMLDFYDQIGTSQAQKRKVAFPEARHHVISSHIMSKDINNVATETFRFAEEVLGLKPVE